MNDPHFEKAARELIAVEPELGKRFNLAQLAERLRIFAKQMKLAGELKAQIED